VFAWFITFNFINISWVFFRAKEWDDALKVLDGMFFGAFSLDIASQTLLWILLAFVVVLAFINSFELHQRFKLSYKNLLLTLILLYLALERLSSFSEFLYFNF
jgi:hypothetical protein